MASGILSVKYSSEIGHLSNHFHDCHQLLYIEEGQIRITIGDKCYRAGSGSFILISRFENHSIQIESAVYRRYSLRIHPDLPGYERMHLSMLVNRPENFCHVLDVSGASEIPSILKQMVQEWNDRQELWEKQLEYCMGSLLICLHRHYPELEQTKSETLKFVHSIQSYLEENYTLPCNLDALASRYHISASHLSHVFKKTVGQSVIGYLNACRFAAAKRLLCETEMDIAMVVSTCGFTDCSNFSRRFRAITGMTPTQFRLHNKH